MPRHLVRRSLTALALVAGAAVPASHALAGPAPRDPAPAQAPEDDFYTVPDPLPVGPPGAIIATEPVPSPGLEGSLLRVMYHSRSLQGADIAVTGLIAIPDTPPPPGGYPVISWAHGTTGLADVCAPSKEGVEGIAGLANQLLAAGYVVVATDYEGLGTPGRHPYIVGQSEARGVIDIVRAAHQLPGLEVSDQWLVWGHSQGGHAALWAGQIAPEWAPELELVGTVAGAPPSQLNLIYVALRESPFRHYILMAGAGFAAAYPEADLSEVLTPYALSKLGVVDTGCAGDVAEAYAGDSTEDLLKADPYTIPTWARVISAQEPGTVRTEAPILIIHGGADEQIPVVSSQLLLDRMCGFGQVVQRRVYEGQSHAGVIGPSFADMLAWMAARFADEPAPNDCTARPTGPPVAAPDLPPPAPSATPVEGTATFTG